MYVTGHLIDIGGHPAGTVEVLETFRAVLTAQYINLLEMDHPPYDSTTIVMLSSANLSTTLALLSVLYVIAWIRRRMSGVCFALRGTKVVRAEQEIARQDPDNRAIWYSYLSLRCFEDVLPWS